MSTPGSPSALAPGGIGPATGPISISCRGGPNQGCGKEPGAKEPSGLLGPLSVLICLQAPLPGGNVARLRRVFPSFGERAVQMWWSAHARPENKAHRRPRLLGMERILAPWVTQPLPPVITRRTGTPVSGSWVNGGSLIFCTTSNCRGFCLGFEGTVS